MLISVTKKSTGDCIDTRPFEIVETKGRGHPDTICDHLAEQVGASLINMYREQTGKICHFNVDKALLRGGCSVPRFGGGEVTHPIEIYIAGRATDKIAGLNIDHLVKDVCNSWFLENIHNIDADKHIIVHSLVRPGSTDLSELFSRSGQKLEEHLSNDTSFGVGFAPLSQLEKMVCDISKFLASVQFLKLHPEYGEDIKVMGIRKYNEVELVIACAFVDKYVSSLSDYLDKKKFLISSIETYIAGSSKLKCTVKVNTADKDESGSIYLTVTGTSGECGDDGQVGRGNRVNGLITPYRPMSLEATSGKNPVTHVGRIYNYWAHQISQNIVEEFGVLSCECFLVNQIGNPVSKPNLVDLKISEHDGNPLNSETQKRVEKYVLKFLEEKSREY